MKKVLVMILCICIFFTNTVYGLSTTPSKGDSTGKGSLSAEEEIESEIYDVVEDINQYGGWEFKSFFARSAEFEVVGKCWGEDPHVDQKKAELNKSIGEMSLIINLGKNGTFKYDFNLQENYAQDTEKKDHEALYLLTYHNYQQFVQNIFIEQVIEKIYFVYYDEHGREHKDTASIEYARRMAWLRLGTLTNEIRAKYGKIDVVVRNDQIKEFYVINTHLTDLENKIFTERRKGELFEIKTDKYNDVFTWHSLGGGMTDIINSADFSSRAPNKRQYRLKEENFYLCEGCSKCEECSALVAYGEEDTEQGWYLSKFCAEHACFFCLGVVGRS